MKSTKKSFIAIFAAMAFAGAAPLAGATENCEVAQVGSVQGNTLKIKGTDRVYQVTEDKVEDLKGWSEDSYVRLCGGNQMTNISFLTLPTYTVSELTATGTTQVAPTTPLEAEQTKEPA